MEPSSQTGPGGVNGSNGMSRAEKFEDEKKRIIESCFGKKHEDGSLLESYITHIRIVEDAAYPSTPPPPTASHDTKKQRLIIVSVRKTGRVRMHKARENANGTFSIGKTWQLDDLTAVQSYSGSVPSSYEEEQHKQWAAGVGFAITIGKPYYWQANTPKEKQFFIASLVKIYIKYTGGKSPELLGFDGREKDQLLGVASGTTRGPPPQQQQQQQTPPVSANVPPYGQPRNQPPRREPSREPMVRQQPSREAMQRPPQPPPSGSSSFTSQSSRPQMRMRREESPSGSMDSFGPGATSSPQANLRRLAGNNPSQDSFATRSDDANSLPPRSRGGMSGTPNAPGRFPDRSVTPNSQRAMTPESGFGQRDTSEIPPMPATSPLPATAPISAPPERRRPPMPILGDSRQRGLNVDEGIVPAPLLSPGMRRDDLRLPTRSTERSQSRQPEAESITNKLSPANSNTSDRPQTPRSVPETTGPNGNLNPTPVPAVAAPADPEPTKEPEPEVPEADARPGLGPMIKKKTRGEVANTMFRAAKAANAFSSFKPRAGGAAERLREAQSKPSDGPDGISGVVPAPSLVRGMSDESVTSIAPLAVPKERPLSHKLNNSIPEVKITVPQSNRPSSVEGPINASKERAAEPPKVRENRRQKTPVEAMQKELAAIGIDSAILGGRGGELVSAWEEFGWSGEGIRSRNIDNMKSDIERELNRIQAGGWLKMMTEEDERIEAVKKGLDHCMDECDELDGLLTLYAVELGTLTEDVAYIEAQSQGLQVQTANQKLLHTELKGLLDTISLSSDQLACLREASLESSRGLEEIEASLVMLFKAMITIDPSLSMSGPRPSEDGSLTSGKPGGFGNSEIGSMRVLQEKKDVYRNECAIFLRRLKPFLQVKFAAAVDETRKALEREKGINLSRSGGKARLDPRNHDLARTALWKYSPLMLFSREVDRVEWGELLKAYEFVCKGLYQDEFRDATFALKRMARKPTADENEILFTSQAEKQTEGIATTARKLTVKRSQTLAKSLRSPIGDNSSKTSVDKASDGRLNPFEVFSLALDEMVPIITMEQNFIVQFFHLTSLEQHDFPDAVALAPPDSRRGVDLKKSRVMDPNRDLARLVIQSMEEVYSFFLTDMQALVEWSTQADPLQGVGVIVAIERKLVDFEESSQEYLSRSLQKLHTRLIGLFSKFLDEQIRAIEDTKVKVKKRKGVIAFIRTFPHFSAALETMLTSAGDLEIRQTVNDAYIRINKTMFESLKVIARENPGAQTAGADPEDKEALNYEILLIENMNHYLEEVDSRSNPVLEDWKQSAAQEMDEHMSLYLGAVIRRPLGKLLDYLESTESLMLSRQPGDSLSKISSMPSHSKSTFRKILAGYDSKELRKGIVTLKQRVDKHYGDADDPGLSRNLVAKVISNCEKYYEQIEDRILTIIRDVYDGDVVSEWNRAEISQAFRAGAR